jgi:membrane associated rhomboid family serine protease
MGLYDREYSQERYQPSYHYGPPMRMGFPGVTTVTKWLLIINAGVFLAAITMKPLGVFIYDWFQLDPTTLPRMLQLWRLITYQFLHGGVWHVFFNMLGLYFLGPALERYWGGRKFLVFYLSCGAAGGVFYLLLVAVGFLPAMAMVGASGAILGILAACAILFPHIRLFIFPLFFPVSIRTAAIIFGAMYLFYVVTKAANAGGDAAHLAGMATGAIYVLSQSWRDRIKFKIQTSAQHRKAAKQQNLQAELDRILAKVHEHGVHSLTSKEKRILKQATEAERMRNGSTSSPS